MRLRDKIIIIVLIVSIIFFKYLWWLFFFTLLLSLLLFIFNTRYGRLAWLIVLLIPLIYICWNFMFYEKYFIRTQAMLPTLSNRITVRGEKWAYGGVLLTNPADWPLVTAFTRGNQYKTEPIFRKHRISLWGPRDPQAGDIVVCYEPGSVGRTNTRRCVALPGDTLLICEGRVKVNGSKHPFEEQLTLLYLTYFSDETDLREFVRDRRLNVSSDGFSLSRDAVYLTLDEPTLLELRKSGMIDSLIFCHRAASRIPYYLEKETGWNSASWGPFRIPYKGMSIEWNDKNRRMYGRLLRETEEVSDTTGLSSYTFKQDYYFVTGDNRSNSIDSRHYGPVPRKNIEARVQDPGFSFSWKRDNQAGG